MLGSDSLLRGQEGTGTSCPEKPLEMLQARWDAAPSKLIEWLLYRPGGVPA